MLSTPLSRDSAYRYSGPPALPANDLVVAALAPLAFTAAVGATSCAQERIGHCSAKGSTRRGSGPQSKCQFLPNLDRGHATGCGSRAPGSSRRAPQERESETARQRAPPEEGRGHSRPVNVCPIEMMSLAVDSLRVGPDGVPPTAAAHKLPLAGALAVPPLPISWGEARVYLEYSTGFWFGRGVHLISLEKRLFRECCSRGCSRASNEAN